MQVPTAAIEFEIGRQIRESIQNLIIFLLNN